MQKHHWIALGIFILIGAVLFVALLFVTAPAAVAPSPPGISQPSASNLDAETLRVAKSLYCPVCPGVPLDVCETQACEQWRALIHQKLSEGQTPEQISAYFVDQYGERVLGAPRAEGLNLAIYALPALAIGGGAALLYLAARRWTRAGPAPAPNLTPVTRDPIRERIERELKEND